MTGYFGFAAIAGLGTGVGVSRTGRGRISASRSYAGHFFAVPIGLKGGAIEVGTRRPLFSGQAIRSVAGDFTHDGKRFVAAVPPASTEGASLTLVTNWASELKGR